MTGMEARGEIKHADIQAVVIRADGTREDLGTISTSRGGLRGWWIHWRANRRIEKANRRLEGK